MEKIESKEWVVSTYAEQGIPTAEHLKLRSAAVVVGAGALPDGHVAMQVLLVSVDPYLRNCIAGRHENLRIPQFKLNQVIRTFGVGRVIRSKDPNYTEGDIVLHPMCPVAEYCVVPTDKLQRIKLSKEISPVDYLNALGIPGFSAWLGINFIGDPKPGEKVFISAAAGAVGMFAGQLAKLKGCKVVGSVGTDEKVNFLKEELNFDNAFNYKKEPDLDVALGKYFPDGIDVYFDNVGGKMLEAVLNHVNRRARIPVCGMISQYNQVYANHDSVRTLMNLIIKEVKMEGFIISSHMDRFGEFAKEMEGYINEGKLISKFKINYGIDSFLSSLVSLFSSSNIGKVVIEINK